MEAGARSSAWASLLAELRVGGAEDTMVPARFGSILVGRVYSDAKALAK